MDDPTLSRLPQRIMMPSASNWMLDSLILNASNHVKHGGDRPAGTYLFGFRLPTWQRPAVWSPEQQQSFLHSWCQGLDIGRFVYTQAEGAAFDGPLDNLLIDGQQRLRTLWAFLHGEITFQGLPWSELTDMEQRQFKRTLMPTSVLDPRDHDEAFLRELYIRLNYGGVAHSPEHHPDVLDPRPEREGQQTPEPAGKARRWTDVRARAVSEGRIDEKEVAAAKGQAVIRKGATGKARTR